MENCIWTEKEGITGTAQDLLDRLIGYAVREGASDIHIEPLDESVRVRCRFDGVLYTVAAAPPEKGEPFLIRLKIMAGLDIANKRLPQDGRILWESGAVKTDLRLSTMPTVRGEKAVIRILGSRTADFSLDGLGLPERGVALIRGALTYTNGLIIICGPTGSGKTTTLYAALRELDSDAVSIATLEDPVEYKINGFSQSQVNAKGGVEFPQGLRALLRQDPDILVIGEIRDGETATIAVRAALTGHLVLSTLHAATALHAPGRLIDMGIEPYLLADALLCLMAQRLVRRKCSVCGGKGCKACHGSGYGGRLCISEVVPMNAPLRNAIRSGKSEGEMQRLAGEGLLFSESIRRSIGSGLTDAAEIRRVYKE